MKNTQKGYINCSFSRQKVAFFEYWCRKQGFKSAYFFLKDMVNKVIEENNFAYKRWSEEVWKPKIEFDGIVLDD